MALTTKYSVGIDMADDDDVSAVSIVARDRKGSLHVLYAGSPGVVETSRVWRLRLWWWRVTRRLTICVER